jgi:hypothetical protein
MTTSYEVESAVVRTWSSGVPGSWLGTNEADVMGVELMTTYGVVS